jgi:hypothetical protein
MKTLLVMLMTLTTFALPQGKFVLDKIQCRDQNGVDGKTLKLGGKLMVYKINLEITDTELLMDVHAKSGPWAPFRLICDQKNEGKYSLIGDNHYEGFLEMTLSKCNAKMWERILKKHSFGVEEQGVFTYTYENGKLITYNKDTVTKYSCEKTNSYPVYYYDKI